MEFLSLVKLDRENHFSDFEMLVSIVNSKGPGQTASEKNSVI